MTAHGLDEDSAAGGSGDASSTTSGLIVPMTSSDDARLQHTAEVGTESYMSPEQIARQTYDHKVIEPLEVPHSWAE